MALVLDRTYPPTAPGIRDFLLNRGLRIYPPCLAVVLLTIGAMSIDERVFTPLNDHTFGWPTNFDGWLRNFGIFGLNIHLVSKELAFAPRFIPPSRLGRIGPGFARRVSIESIGVARICSRGSGAGASRDTRSSSSTPVRSRINSSTASDHDRTLLDVIRHLRTGPTVSTQ